MAKNENATEGTFSTAPFISFDGVDDQGHRAEVKVVKGYGDVITVTPSNAGKSHKIEFAVSNTKYNPAGWSRDSKLLALIEKAKANNEPIHFRIETRRKDGQDRAASIDSLSGLATAKDSIVKSLAAVKLEGDDEWLLSEDAVTRLDEDPSTGSSVNANKQNIEKLAPATRTADSGNSRNGSYEPAPYVGRWHDAVNPGTIAVSIPVTFLTFLMEMEAKDGFTLERDRRKEIALTLLKVANLLQKDIYEKHLQAEYVGPDLTAGSHTRARALIFESIRHFTPLDEKTANDEAAFKKWQKNLYSASYAMWVWAIESVDEYVS